ncbi:hypothetical protein Lal_00049358 [Lupinus albus]|uniref:Putative F-box domain-containing protein n=1 Tax=Lupinus albus TaxID=3870 RepID=A0A6A4R1V4_LUPAL|nr:putative F-box domain-containing protein [Lupinus albus]KAF1877964.1 hypothetical protein Lal_00049358 [Lupinus albus]
MKFKTLHTPMTCTSGEPKATTTENHGGATTFSIIQPEVIETHILTRLDGPTLASAGTTSSQLHALSSHHHLWDKACYSTWPSTNTPRVRDVISTFPNGSRSFFSDSYPTFSASQNNFTSPINLNDIPELISAVDIFHRENLIFSKVVETETNTDLFRFSPFRLDLIDKKDAVKIPVTSDTCHDFGEEMMLSWIIIDRVGRRAVNVSSKKAVTVQRNKINGEMEARFVTVVDGGEVGTSSEVALFSVVVTWGGVVGEEIQVREVSLQIEDMEGMNLYGKDSLVILKRALEGKRGKAKDKKEESDNKFVKEGEVRKEGRLDILFVGLALLSFVCFLVSFL